MTNKLNDLQTLLNCQLELLRLNETDDYEDIPKELHNNLYDKILEIQKNITSNNPQKPLDKDEAKPSESQSDNKFSQKLTYSREGFMIRQPANGGTYMLWSGTSNDDVQCGIGFDLDNAGYINADLFLAETRDSHKGNNKDIDLYIYADPYTEDYTDYRRVAFSDLKEALEID